jgi:hypothetical protein
MKWKRLQLAEEMMAGFVHVAMGMIDQESEASIERNVIGRKTGRDTAAYRDCCDTALVRTRVTRFTSTPVLWSFARRRL